MDVFRIEGGNGTKRTRIEQGPGDETGEVEGKVWGLDTAKLGENPKPQTPNPLYLHIYTIYIIYDFFPLYFLYLTAFFNRG
jgi:hypothetical protein